MVAPAHAQEPPPADAALVVQELRASLRALNAAVVQLSRRVEYLEGRLEAGQEQPPPGEVGSTAQASPEPAVPEPPGEAAAAEGEPAAAAPGEFEVDEEAVERALERTLVRTGVLLLPSGSAEFDPSFSYTRRVVQNLASVGDVPVLAERRRHEFDWSFGLRVGLPFDSQLELDLPYTMVNESRVVGGFEDEDTGAGLGDFSFGIAKTLLREQRWWPDVVARINWNSGSGTQSDDGVLLGGGFQQILGQVSAIKREDPLAFVAAAGYRTSFEENDLKPGGELLLSIGTVLAASPDTSLSLSLSQQFAREAEFEGERLSGTDEVASTLNIGASSILGAGVFLDGTVSIGLTDDAPDYAFTVSMPIRFGLPGF